MRSQQWCLALLTFVTLVTAQNFLPTTSSSSFPGCALSCAVLIQAQQLCTPPVVAQTNQLAYENCFCQSAAVQPMYASPDSVCAGECTIEADRVLLRTWFTSFCQKVGQGVDPVSSTATTISPTSTLGSGGTTPTITLSTSSNPTSSSTSVSNWWPTHYKWIIMVIVLFISFILIAIFAVWLKKRLRRRREEKIARMSGFPMTQEKSKVKVIGATPDLWGPHQHMAATQGYQYNRHDGVPPGGALGRSNQGKSRRHSSSKDKHVEAVKVEEIMEAAGEHTRSKSSRPRPSELDPELRAAEAERTKSQKRRDLEEQRARDKSIERGLQGFNSKETF